MSTTEKKMSPKDQEQVIRQVQNDVNGTLGVDGFLVGLVGRKVVISTTTTTVTGDTSLFTFSENGNTLYVLKLIYSDGTQTQLLSAERTA